MLISFSVRNFRTFRERVEWSLVASPDKTREEDNVVDLPAFGLRLLKSAVVYGANASGKSKLVDVLEYMRWFVRSSSKNGQAGESTQVEPFKLNPDSVQDTSEFEIQFVHQNALYRYGFEVTSAKVRAEWLFTRTEKGIRNKPEIELFYRTEQEITHHPRRFGGIVGELVKNAAVRENALLLSVAAQFNQPRATAILEWFNQLVVLSGRDEAWEGALTFILLRYPDRKQHILDFLRDADLDIDHVQEEEQDLPIQRNTKPTESAENLRNWSIQQHANAKTLHRAYNDAREPAEPVEFSLQLDESAGTQKMLVLAGPVLSAIDQGHVLVVDEMDARLHPNLISKIVQLFNSKTTNPNNAQLLFNTHDTNLLASGNFRRDQIWFTEKNRYGEATLYSLADFKTDVVKKDDDFEANYVRGKYGAVPYLGNFNALPKSDVASEAEPAQ
ncbi:AAA family ATPase [Hymenobacter sp. PAMC 26628]|uniref:AAA family ATPase n=1 Tax=Hymenobacter sp. PAMC 26628 TaxID=1484118 RepID=UPI0009020210|nr:ATP-binding protein [Hymenobacter sp. PAMC 26628]